MSKKDDKKLVQGRSENSVLFSLDALSQSAKTEEKAKEAGQAAEDNSGFINLNAIAASSKFVAEGSEGGAAAGGAPAPMVGPSMIPMGSEKKSNAAPLIAIGVLSVVLILALGGLAYVLTQDKGTQQVEAPAGNGAAAAAAPTEKKEEAAPTEKKEEAPAAADTEKKEEADDEIAKLEEQIPSKEEEAAAAEDPEKLKELEERKAKIEAARKEHEEKMKTDPKYRKEYLEKVEKRKELAAKKKKEEEERKAAAAAAAQKEKDAAPPADTTKKDGAARKTDNIPSDVDKILSDITPGSKPKTDKPKETAKTEAPKEEGLSRTAIKGTVGRYMGRIRSCGGGDKSGTVMVRFSIQPNGSVGGAAVTNSKNGTPEGNCVLAVVRSMSFPSFSGSAKTINFPFRLP